MPEVSRFLGIIIYFAYNDYNPPHFHARYGEYDVTIRIADGVVSGTFPRRALSHVLEWYTQHQSELLENWELARDNRPLRSIAPLE